nr:RNA-directed DNA polymerase, eukaryota [Tanacetum cinerariifolium]
MFWEDLWVGDSTLKMQYPRLHLIAGAEEEQLHSLLSCIDFVVLPQIPDRWVWSLSSSGDFSVKSVRTLLDDSLLPNFDVPTRWINVVPIKVNILAWRVRLDKLPTRLNLSRLVWRLILRWWDFVYIECSSYDDWLNWFNNIRLLKRLKEIFEGVCYVMCWFNGCTYNFFLPKSILQVWCLKFVRTRFIDINDYSIVKQGMLDLWGKLLLMLDADGAPEVDDVAKFKKQS